MKSTQSKINLIKIGRELGTTCCLGCKGFTHNFSPQDVKMTNKVLREKSNCVVCRSNKSRFLKQKHNSEKLFLQVTSKFVVKTVKKHADNTFPKKLVLISKNKIK